MKKLSALTLAILLSIGLYVAVFSVVKRPLTVGGVDAAFQSKTDYANSLPHPKLAIWAGSNGRYSHRCEAFTEVLRVPCVNLSIAVGVGIDFQLLNFEKLLQAGDVLYVPLEYSQYLIDRAEMEGGAENITIAHQSAAWLDTLGFRRIVRAWGSFDLPFLVHGSIEMALAGTGFQRRGGKEGLTPQGDQMGHTAADGMAYRAFLAKQGFDTRPLPEHSRAFEVIEGFLDRMRAKGVVVVGGLPTTPDSAKLNDADVARLKALYERHGQYFLVLPNRSQYPLSCFFDTVYHLHEDCQKAHSSRVAEALVQMAVVNDALRARP
jgi:hypothetical protein